MNTSVNQRLAGSVADPTRRPPAVAAASAVLAEVDVSVTLIRRRRRWFPVAIAAALVIAGCSGSAAPPSNVSSTSATFNANASCSGGSPTPCSYYWQYGIGQYDNANNFHFSYSGVTAPVGAGHANTGGQQVPLSTPVRNLSPGTTYRYQFCGEGDTVSSPVCVGPDETGSTYETFTTPGPPSPEQFGQSQATVTPGSTLTLHWNRNEKESFFLTSSGANAFPNFESAATWPTPGGTWQSANQSWATAARAVTLAIPASAAAGSKYVVQLVTCNTALAVNPCSNSSGSTTPSSTVTITVAGSTPSCTAGSAATCVNWTVEKYTNLFSVTAASATAPATGNPLDVAFDSGDNIWSDSEFSDGVEKTAPGQSTVSLFQDPYDTSQSPFYFCFTGCGSYPISSFGERVVVADGMVWFTQGGGFLTPPGVTNHSEVVAYDPANGGFCTYQVPSNNNEVMGLAATGSGSSTVIWFLESGAGNVYYKPPDGTPAAVDSFSPSQVPSSTGQLGMNCLPTGQFYPLTTTTPSFHQTLWPTPPSGRSDQTWLAMITPDPDRVHLWVTDWAPNGGDAEVAEVAATGTPTIYTLPPQAGPWQVAVDPNYVYAIDYGDNNLVRINKASGRIDKVPLPVTTDLERGYGLALSNSSGDERLYFTLSDDSDLSTPVPFGAVSTFGYVDLSTWGAPSAAPAQGVVFTGLSSATDPSGSGDFRGIAASSDGELAIADQTQVLRLTPGA